MEEKVIELKKSKFDPSLLRLDPSKQTLEVEKLLTNVPVRKPPKQSFIRVRPEEEYRLSTGLIRLKELGETYIVAPDLISELSEEIEPATLYTCIDRNGAVFLWPVKLPDETGKLDRWNESAHVGAEFGMESWVRISANRDLGCYEVLKPKGELDQPKWPDKTFEELLELGFKDFYIETLDHPVIRKLRGFA